MKRGMTGGDLLKTCLFPRVGGDPEIMKRCTPGSGPQPSLGKRRVFIPTLPPYPHTPLTPPEQAAGALGSGGVVVSRAGAV